MIEDDGWYQVRQKGSHRQFKHNSSNSHYGKLGPSDIVYSP